MKINWRQPIANGKIRFGKQSGWELALAIPDCASNTEVMLPESGTVASVDGVVTDNAIARYDGTIGVLKNSNVTIDDNATLALTNSANGRINIGASNNYIYCDTANNLILGTTGSDRVLINSSGNLLVCTTTDNGVDKLQVNWSIGSGLVSTVTDLNKVQRNGAFVTGDFTFSLASNAPCGYGTLHQIARSTAECTQMVIDITNGKLYTRCYVYNIWTSWVEK